MHFQVLVSSCALGGLHFQAPNDPSCVPLSARGGIPASQEGRPAVLAAFAGSGSAEGVRQRS